MANEENVKGEVELNDDVLEDVSGGAEQLDDNNNNNNNVLSSAE